MTQGYAVIAALLAFAAIWAILRDKTAPLAPVQYSGVVSYVIDGDTLILRGSKERLRLWGVDAPEIGERGSQAARTLLNDLSNGQPVTYIKIEADKYGRTVARVFLKSGLELNRAMIDSPHATEYMRYSKGFYAFGG